MIDPRAARILPGDDPVALAEAADLLRAGSVVAFPTETVYGLGANALDPVAVAQVFAIKDRPSFDPLIVHVAERDTIGGLVSAEASADPRVESLAERFWPGPLTLVLGKSGAVPGIVTAGLDTVGIRMPDHPVATALIRAAGVPVAAPSANRFGGVSPTRAEHVARQLGDRVALILDGGRTRIGVESTVLLLAGGRCALLRPGGVPLEALEAVLGSVEMPADEEARSLSPGRAAVHYAPSTRLLVAAADEMPPMQGARVALLAADDDGRVAAEAAGGPFAAVEVLDRAGDLVASAARLFDALHRLDDAGADLIVAQPVPETGLGRAIMDRLRRASAATMRP